MSFYVTLPSNSSMNLFPNNTATHYSTELANELLFEVPYEVALVQIDYNHSWHYYLGELYFNHRGEEHDIHLNSNEGQTFEEFIKIVNDKIEKIYIPIETVNADNNNENFDRNKYIDELKNRMDFPRLIYENQTLRFNCPIKSFFKFVGPIASYLSIKEYQKIWTNQMPMPIHENIFSLTQIIFVYTDIVEYQYVGDSYAPLLQTVITSDKTYATMVSVKFDNPHYISVNKTSIKTIEIDLRDDLGNKILFQNGKTIVKLHFRPKRYGF